jgi:hypothetical protein
VVSQWASRPWIHWSRPDREEPTDEWIVTTLLKANAPQCSIGEIGNILKTKATEEFRKRQYRDPLTIVAAGYLNDSLFLGHVSNEEGPSGEPLPLPNRDFFSPPVKLTGLGLVDVTGDLRPIKSALDRRIRKRVRRFYYQRPYETVEELVTLMRAASRDRAGMRIGRNCMAVIALPGRRFDCRAYPENASPVSFLPNVVIKDFGLQRVSLGPLDPQADPKT